MAEASIKIQQVRIGPARPVDCEHGAAFDYIAPAPTIRPVTQVGHNTFCPV